MNSSDISILEIISEKHANDLNAKKKIKIQSTVGSSTIQS